MSPVTRPHRVLLAEDDGAARDIMARVLEDIGLEVIPAEDGGRMLVALARQYKDGHSPTEVDLVVTDVHMPVIGGLELVKGLRKAGWRTPVIVVTAFASDETKDTVVSVGGTLLEKPLDLERFENAVRGALMQDGSTRSRR